MKFSNVFSGLSLVFVLTFLMSCNKNNDENGRTFGDLKSGRENLGTGEPSQAAAVVTVLASDLAYPRGLKFGPDGDLYVSLAGSGGSTSTAGLCNETVPPMVQSLGGLTSSLIKISGSGNVTTVADNFPSAINGFGDIQGLADVAFVGDDLYGLLIAGCSHGNIGVPTSVVKIDPENHTWTVIADLSAYLHNNPTAVTNPTDFEPDGVPYSMVTVNGVLFVLEPNHGELIKVTTDGKISRVVDLSAKYGHIVPTALGYHGNFFVGNLGHFPLVQGSSNIYKITPSGESELWATGFTAVLGVAFDKENRLYVLESSSISGFPTPGQGRVIRTGKNGVRDIIVDGLNFPTAMTFGPGNTLYISDNGYGPPGGRVLKVTF